MKNMSFVLFTICTLIICGYSQISDVVQKTTAIEDAINKISDSNKVSAYDNFIGYDGNEYVIVYIEQVASFLLRIDKVSDKYTSVFVTNENEIQTILQTRYSQYDNQKHNIEQLSLQSKENILQFNDSRFLHEAKYDLLLGVSDFSCKNYEECKTACKRTKVCNYVLEKNGDEIVYQLISYQEQKSNLDSLISNFTSTNIGDYDEESQLLESYLQIIENMRGYAQNITKLGFTNENNQIYAGNIIYDITPIEDSYMAIQTAIAPTKAIEERLASIETIKRTTSLNRNKILLQEQKDEQVSQQSEVIQTQLEASNEQTLQNESNNDTQVQQYPHYIFENNIFTTENLMLFFALLIVITTVVYMLYTVKMWWDKKNTNGFVSNKSTTKKNSAYNGRGIEPLDSNKKIESLEDLL